jgi:voltage-gated potassium channel
MIILRKRFTLLLIALLFLAIVNPLLEEIGFVRASIPLNISLILLSGAYAATNRAKTFVMIIAVALSPIILMWFQPFFHWNFQLAVEILIAGFFVVIAAVILKQVLKDEKVTWEKISAAFCFYLLIGIVWGFFYHIISNLRPGSFLILGTGFSQYVYYSMITISTVGYGDIIPLTPFTRALAYVEAISGQFYLTVLVARLVGLHIVHASRED